ncbi:SRPBCC family protein [Mesorhizobium sp. ESP6-5]|uniref:SRPBCC family protein n=1 Tax=Mesorhizobium sp. ESP6-5 TaxID=2876623 RepID=UPI001CCF3061|nr:SRPBCC family protein [Mesorhizobium sp. ESP6-5]MBZ9758151.1 SRPBCC family protein [Mesorhizobium sp. ESP6-5]
MKTPIDMKGRMTSDLATRDPDIHWPAGFEPDRADLFAHNEARLKVSCNTVWQQIVDARAWPTWYPNAQDVTLLDGAPLLGPDVRWTWTTFGLTIESRVHEFVPGRRLGWFGSAPGEAPAFYHTWLLRPDGDGCHVVMDEAGVGSGAAAFRKADEGRMHRGHALWLTTLEWVSQGR